MRGVLIRLSRTRESMDQAEELRAQAAGKLQYAESLKRGADEIRTSLPPPGLRSEEELVRAREAHAMDVDAQREQNDAYQLQGRAARLEAGTNIEEKAPAEEAVEMRNEAALLRRQAEEFRSMSATPSDAPGRSAQELEEKARRLEEQANRLQPGVEQGK